MNADCLKIMFLELHRNKELAQAVDFMMVRKNIVYILMIKVNIHKLFSQYT